MGCDLGASRCNGITETVLYCADRLSLKLDAVIATIKENREATVSLCDSYWFRRNQL